MGIGLEKFCKMHSMLFDDILQRKNGFKQLTGTFKNNRNIE
jgi:hypothetical protein